MPAAWNTAELAALDKRHGWHPFTPMEAWCDPGHEPVFLVRGQGVWLWDSHGARYLDGNSSIWTNIHGHSHPKLVAAIHNQAATIAHSSFLGFSNPWATLLASRLVSFFPNTRLQRVFFTDDGSTAIECALKMAIQYRQLCRQTDRLVFGAFAQAYHGDTLGAASLGGVPVFHDRFARWGLQPIRIAGMNDLLALDDATIRSLNAIVIEPLIQGVNRMHLWPTGMLRDLRAWCDAHDVLLILDEVMTGFGRTGKMFACQHEDVVPDFLCLAKGITAGTLPLAATLVTDGVFASFLGPNDGHHVFHYGHSYCGNPLGCAAALASLDIFAEENTLVGLPDKITALDRELHRLRETFPNNIGAIRQLGLVAGIDIIAAPGVPFAAGLAMGSRICLAARAHGLLTRPILDTIVIMPPLCITELEITFLCEALGRALADTLRSVNNL